MNCTTLIIVGSVIFAWGILAYYALELCELKNRFLYCLCSMLLAITAFAGVTLGMVFIVAGIVGMMSGVMI